MLSLSLSDFELADRILEILERRDGLRREHKWPADAARRDLADAFAELRKAGTS